jgi:hypothetical protein
MARSFNGTSDFLAAPNAIVLHPTGPQSQACWVYFNSVASRADFFNLWSSIGSGSSNEAWLLGTVSASHFWYYLSQNGLTAFGVDSNIVASTNTWYHVCGTWDGTNQRIYVNGILRASAVPGLTSIQPSIQGISFGVGDNGAGPRNAFFLNGRLAECAEWNLALSASEVAALAAGSRVYQIRPLSINGYWPLDGLASPEPDLSEFANNATATGTSLAAGPPMNLFTPAVPAPSPSVTVITATPDSLAAGKRYLRR